jgi:hypothetical protein
MNLDNRNFQNWTREHDIVGPPSPGISLRNVDPPREKWRDTAISASVPGLVRFKAAQDWLDRTSGAIPPSPTPVGAEEFRRFLVQRNGGENVSPEDAARLYNEFLRRREGQR